MKKLIAVIAILLIIDLVLLNFELKRCGTLDKQNIAQKDENWEYIKNTIYSGKDNGDYVYKINEDNYQYPIIIDIKSASLKDSLIVSKILKELRTILPDKKIVFFENFSKKE